MKLVYVSSALALATVCLAAGQGADRSPPVEDQVAVATEERLAKPSKIYFEALDTARKDYRNSVGAALAEAEKIEMYLLDFEMKEEPESDFLFWENRLPKEFFPITPYKSKSRILLRKLLSPEETQKLIPTLQATLKLAEPNGVLCHYPIHGIRVWKGEEILLQSSICWHCGNFTVDYPDGASFATITVPELKSVCDELVPIPEREIKRFKLRGFGSRMKATEQKPLLKSGKKGKLKK